MRPTQGLARNHHSINDEHMHREAYRNDFLPPTSVFLNPLFRGRTEVRRGRHTGNLRHLCDLALDPLCTRGVTAFNFCTSCFFSRAPRLPAGEFAWLSVWTDYGCTAVATVLCLISGKGHRAYPWAEWNFTEGKSGGILRRDLNLCHVSHMRPLRG